MKRLHLIRHAEAGMGGSGGDHARPLTPDGHHQAARLGELLADADLQLVVASSAERAVRTAEALGLPVDARDDLHNADADALREAIEALPEEVDRVALVAHMPGIPDLVDELIDDDADAEARDLLEHGYPTGTVAAFAWEGTWQDLDAARLEWADRG